MKTKLIPILGALLTSAAFTNAAITVPGADGSDGALNITANTEIDLSQAVTGTWNQNNAANAGKGVYDAAKWAVVFKYSSITVTAGATVSFKNHVSRAPVVWLVNGNVTINGIVSLNGKDNQAPPLLSDAGPGGFRGGMGHYTFGADGSAGFGPGGGRQAGNRGHGGGYGTAGHEPGIGGPAYGNPSLIPLIGGSGCSGSINESAGGGGGGGALLLASTGTVSLPGELRCNGGNGPVLSGGGSGGGIRIVCDSLQGAGKLNALGGTGWYPGGLGRIRLERATNSSTLQIVPEPSVIPLAAGATAQLWPPTGAPEVKVVSVGGVNAPADPKASFGSAGADMALPQVSTTPIIIETTNVEQASQVKVRVTPRANANATIVDAAVSSVVSTSPLVVRWTATLPVNVGYSAVQVHVVRP